MIYKFYSSGTHRFSSTFATSVLSNSVTTRVITPDIIENVREKKIFTVDHHREISNMFLNTSSDKYDFTT